jgi:hypothetical protein
VLYTAKHTTPVFKKGRTKALSFLNLFGFFVRNVLTAMTAIFAQLQTILENLFIFVGEIIDAFASRTFQLD